MRILVVGAGAVGSFLGGCLAEAGLDVAFLDQRDVPAGAREPLVVAHPGGRRATVEVAVAGPGDPEALAWRGAPPGAPPDLVLFATKQFDLPAALAVAARWPDAPAMTVQNGIGAEEAVLAARPGAGLVAASLTAAVRLHHPGHGEDLGVAVAHRLRRGGLALAPAAGTVEPVLDELAAAFRKAGLRTVRLHDARAMKWSKLLGNLAGNATCALLDEDPAAVYADPRLFEIERRQLAETVATMRALGLRPVALPGADVRLLVLAAHLPGRLARFLMSRVMGGARGGKMPSLRLHLRHAGGPTEARWLNGAVAEAAARAGVPAPVNGRLAALVDEAAADPERRAWFVGRPGRLVEAIWEAGEKPPGP
ncbi:MAG: 2-dehydropantoate 2-reductase [Chloroflexi bacterium]|nr:2-dehydropantoate 2-reductase [Chloroflexota bacterium]